jgi:hypothetical protein
MEKLLDNLYVNHGEPKTKCPEEEQRIKIRRGNFKRTLERSQYRQLQRLIDDTDNITDRMSCINFAKGVKFGIKLMIELFGDDIEHPPE